MSSHGDEEEEERRSTDSLLSQQQQEPDTRSLEDVKAEQRRKEVIAFYVEQLTLLFYPLILTFALTCWIEITLSIDTNQISNPLMVYDELPSDSIGTRLEGSIMNAVVVVLGIATMTFMFVLCFKYGFYKFLFFWLGLSVMSILGITVSALWVEMMEIYRLPLDFITMTICTWNTAVVGVIAIFWYSPLWLQQGYLIIISAATSISLLRMPPWTTWTVLVAVSIYDLFAVLCPSGPLKLLIKIAEERQEDIPALVYTAGMADFNNSNSPIGGYITRESSRGNSKWSWLSIFKNNNKGYHTIQNEDEVGFLENNMGMNQPQVNELAELPPTTSDHHRRNRQQQDEDEDEEDEDLNAIKLGLGDFIFYSVLVGKASRTDSVTLCLCIIAILTGLAITILILTLNRRALPALPISILFGCITYAISYYMTGPMIQSFSLDVIVF